MAIDIIISPDPGDNTQTATFYGSVGEDRRFVIGTGTEYKSLHGLVHESGTLVYEPAHYPQYGQWAHLIDCTAYCESKRVITCLNTYDRACFTFGCLQFAAHVPDGYFVRWLRLLLQRHDASNYFPDLTFANGHVCHIRDGAIEPLEDATSTAKLMAYLNADPFKVDTAETLAAARFTYWMMADPTACDVHIEVGNSVFRTITETHAKQLGLDGKPDFVIAAVIDILHQGRGTLAEIKTALANNSLEIQLDRLLTIGSSAYATRCNTLRGIIAEKRRSGIFGKQTYDSATKDFHAVAHTSMMQADVTSLIRENEMVAPRSPSIVSSVTDALAVLERRADGEIFEGIRIEDNNLIGNVLLVSSTSEFHSFKASDILDEEAVDGRVTRLWVRRGAAAWRASAIQVGAAAHENVMVQDRTA